MCDDDDDDDDNDETSSISDVATPSAARSPTSPEYPSGILGTYEPEGPAYPEKGFIWGVNVHIKCFTVRYL